MRKNYFIFLIIISAFSISPAFSQVAVVENLDHKSMLVSKDSKLAANKHLVYNFWREVFEAGHLELADKYLSESYIQHNPNVATGRQGFVDFFSKFKKPQPIAEKITMPLVSITAERDLVILSFVKEIKDSNDPTKNYTTTWFDMFRVVDGKIVEHWDGMQKM